jgi:hypothetical protein
VILKTYKEFDHILDALNALGWKKRRSGLPLRAGRTTGGIRCRLPAGPEDTLPVAYADQEKMN